MQKIRNWLLGLLALQIVLLVLVWWLPSMSAANHKPKSLFAFKPVQVDKLVLEQDKQKVELTKQQQHWQLLSAKPLPADQQKVMQAITSLTQLKTNWPIATSKSAQVRFKVAKDNYKRHVKLFAGKKLVADFYLGSSPGFRRNMLRVAGQAAIYSLPINSYDFSADGDDWFDKSLLALKSISQITGADFSLTQVQPMASTGKPTSAAKPVWQLSALASATAIANLEKQAQPVDQAKVTQLVNNLKDLRVQKRLDTPLTHADFSFSASKGKDSPVVSWQFQHQGKQYLVTRSDVAGVFSILQPTFEQLQQVNRNELLKTTEPVSTVANKSPTAAPVKPTIKLQPKHQ